MGRHWGCRRRCGWQRHLDLYLSYLFLSLRQSLLQSRMPGLVDLGPLFHIFLEQGQVLASGRIGFSEEGKGVMQAGQLSALVCLVEICLIRSLDDFLPVTPKVSRVSSQARGGVRKDEGMHSGSLDGR